MPLIKDLKIDPASLGKHKLLVDTAPVAEYVGGQRTDKVVGYRYIVALPEHGFEKLSVKIVGDKLLDVPDGKDYIAVDFKGLEIKVYEVQGKAQLSATAAEIYEIKQPNG